MYDNKTTVKHKNKPYILIDMYYIYDNNTAVKQKNKQYIWPFLAFHYTDILIDMYYDNYPADKHKKTSGTYGHLWHFTVTVILKYL
jgi:hypothetical protein